LKLRAAIVDGRTLVLVVVLGGLFTLQSSNNLDAPKGAYLLLAIAAVAVALVSAPWRLSEARAAVARPWLIAAGALVALLIISFAISRAHGTPFTSWLRDASPYVLFAAAPILAFACARNASQRWLIVVLAVCGVLASLSFTVAWIDRRQLTNLPIDRIVLPSEALAAALLALATALALAGASRRWWWAAMAGAVLGLFFATGTRSTLLLLVVPIGAAIFAGRPRLLAARVVLTEVAIAIAVFFAAEAGIAFANGTLSIPQSWSAANPTPSAQPSATPTGGRPVPTATPVPDRLAQRVGQVGSLIADPGSNQSFQDRLAQTKAAWQAFVGSPLVGVGPGYDFRWTRTSKWVVDAYTMDTPLIYLAKFGLLGLVPLVLFTAAYLRLALELRRRQEARVEYLAVVGFGLVLAVLGMLGCPIEDKGASFGLIFVLALGARALVRERPAVDRAAPVVGRRALIAPRRSRSSAP
jgi:hypothetical protein